jgi:cytochrome P450
LGHLKWGLALQRADPETMIRLRERFGPVFAIGYGPMRFVYLLSRDANEYLLTSDPANLRWRDATKILIPVDGETALVVTDGEEHQRRRRLVQPAFQGKRIRGYLDLMVAEVDHTIDGWTAGEQFDVYLALRASIRRVVVRALFGERLRGQADELGERLQPAFDFLDQSYLRQQLKVPLPGTAWKRARDARRGADELIDTEIAWRRANGVEGDDVLSWLLQEGSLSDAELRDQVVSLIAAGYETTSSTMGWCMYYALSGPEVWKRLRAEVDDVLGDQPLDTADLPALRFVDGVVQEALRLQPAGVVAGRGVVHEVEFDGHRIPAGSLVLYSAYVTHRLPELWTDPDRFDPDRWNPDHEGYREPAPYAFVPFGGGYRRCIGFAFATLELKAMLIQLVRRVDLELTGRAAPQRVGLATGRPDGVPVRVTRVD